jgi:hypothetical protein
MLSVPSSEQNGSAIIEALAVDPRTRTILGRGASAMFDRARVTELGLRSARAAGTGAVAGVAGSADPGCRRDREQ